MKQLNWEKDNMHTRTILSVVVMILISFVTPVALAQSDAKYWYKDGEIFTSRVTGGIVVKKVTAKKLSTPRGVIEFFPDCGDKVVMYDPATRTCWVEKEKEKVFIPPPSF